ncbi:Uncharacterised protein [Kluyvera cryocrescens]|uniref:Uncharacterized protein n=1 Tax=Kluyvera cryocrescens TaxID=580 RepID=A0A485AA80_KLUCR|nr:Uncharacterised protein [Kluyvera cryocrescens]
MIFNRRTLGERPYDPHAFYELHARSHHTPIFQAQQGLGR